jgi:hypothetical protein
MIITLSGCERNDILQSEKKLNERIKGSWKALYPGNQDYHEVWTFGSDGTLSISVDTSSGNPKSGSYSIDARFSNAFIKLREFTFTERTNTGLRDVDLNRDWVIVDLNDKGLYLSTTIEGGALESIEFKKQ